MRAVLAVVAIFLMMGITGSRAQVPLSAYVDANGYINVQKLTCAQLADTYQQDADTLTAWYSGWYNGLAHKHFLDYRKGKIAEHEVIVYCKEHPDRRIIDAIAVVFRDERVAAGAEMRPVPPERLAAAPQAVLQNCAIRVKRLFSRTYCGRRWWRRRSELRRPSISDRCWRHWRRHGRVWWRADGGRGLQCAKPGRRRRYLRRGRRWVHICWRRKGGPAPKRERRHHSNSRRADRSRSEPQSGGDDYRSEIGLSAIVLR